MGHVTVGVQARAAAHEAGDRGHPVDRDRRRKERKWGRGVPWCGGRRRGRSARQIPQGHSFPSPLCLTATAIMLWLASALLPSAACRRKTPAALAVAAISSVTPAFHHQFKTLR